MWSKLKNYYECLRNLWQDEEGSYTFVVVPNDGKSIQRKTYEKKYLRKCVSIVGGTMLAFAVCLFGVHSVIYKCVSDQNELAYYRENRIEQEKRLQELSALSEKMQNDMANLSDIEKQVRKQMAKSGMKIKEEGNANEEFNGMGGPSKIAISEVTVIMEQNKNLHDQLQYKTEDWNKLLSKLKKENYRKEMTPNIWPTTSWRVTSEFGNRRNPFDRRSKDWHAGIDIGGRSGLPIFATASGYVQYAGWYGGYGKYIRLNHDYGYQTIYGHMRSLSVSRGEYVKKGEIIGYMGSTGYSTGPHLHYEVLQWGKEMNPRRLLELK